MRESMGRVAAKSNSQGDKSVTKNIRLGEQGRISFRDLATMAFRRKTALALAQLTGSDERTCKRWLARHSKAPDRALGIVLGEIMRRYG